MSGKKRGNNCVGASFGNWKLFTVPHNLQNARTFATNTDLMKYTNLHERYWQIYFLFCSRTAFIYLHVVICVWQLAYNRDSSLTRCGLELRFFYDYGFRSRVRRSRMVSTVKSTVLVSVSFSRCWCLSLLQENVDYKGKLIANDE